MTAKIQFKAVPDRQEGRALMLSISPPGTWFDDPEYVVFVGGNGIGRRKTQKGAEVLLLEGAKTYCKRRMAEAQAELAHWGAALKRLEARGLEPC